MACKTLFDGTVIDVDSTLLYYYCYYQIYLGKKEFSNSLHCHLSVQQPFENSTKLIVSIFIIYLYAGCRASKFMVQSSLQFQAEKKKHLFTVYIRGAKVPERHRKILEVILHSWVKLSLVISLEMSLCQQIYLFSNMIPVFPFPFLALLLRQQREKKNVVRVIRVLMLKQSHLEIESIYQYKI